MAFKIEKLPNEPIVVCTMFEHFNPVKEYEDFWKQLGQTIEGMEAPIYRITVLRTPEITFGDMTISMAAEAKSGMPGSSADPRVRSILVSGSVLAQIATASMKQEQYGQLDTPLFATLDEALAYVRQQISK